MDGEGSSERKGSMEEHVFFVRIADSNGEELPEVLRSCALDILQRLQCSACTCNHSVLTTTNENLISTKTALASDAYPISL